MDVSPILKYRAPLVAGLLMAAGLGWWATFEHRAQERRHRAELERFVDGALLALDASHNALRPLAMRPERRGPLSGIRHPPLPRAARGPDDLEPLEQVMEQMVEAQDKIRWIAIVVNGDVVASAGPVSTSLAVNGRRGQRVEEGCFLAWRPLGAPEGPRSRDRSAAADRGQAPAVEKRPLPPGAPIAVVALEAVLPSDAVRKDALQIVQKIGVGALGVIAVLFAWVLGIRSRALAHRLEAEQVQRAHLEELSLAASGLAHETKNPLGIIRGLAQRMEQTASLSDEQRSSARQILEEADHAVSRLGEFMSYARVRRPEPGPVNGRAVLTKAADVLAADLESAGVAVQIVAPDLTILADVDMLLQVLLNLVLNSLEASPRDSQILLRLEATGGRATLTVEDHGRGMEPELAARAFQPYVTGRSDGHGLGLAIVKRLVERHGWSIAVDSRLGSGTTVTLAGIPIAKPAEGGA